MSLELKAEHSWDVEPSEAIEIQRSLAPQVAATPLQQEIRTIAGIDVSVKENRVRAAVTVIRLPNREVVDQAIWEGDVPFPYVPGLLSFRELPAVLPALEKLETVPDAYMTDSHGYAHPRRFGLACHLGVLFDQPVVGVAKSRLVGEYEEPAPEKGAHSPLTDEGEIIGAVVRTRTEVNPVFVSIGHRMTLEHAIALTLESTTRYKIPAPTRQAHLLSRRGLDS